MQDGGGRSAAMQDGGGRSVAMQDGGGRICSYICRVEVGGLQLCRMEVGGSVATYVGWRWEVCMLTALKLNDLDFHSVDHPLDHISCQHGSNGFRSVWPTHTTHPHTPPRPFPHSPSLRVHLCNFCLYVLQVNFLHVKFTLILHKWGPGALWPPGTT